MKHAKQLRTVFFVALAIALSGLLWSSRAYFAPLDVGSRAPDYTAQTLAGESVSLSGYRGEVVLLNLWATWCAPCVREMPALQRLHESLSSQGLRIVAVSVDESSSPLAPPGSSTGVDEFVARFGLTFTVLHDPTGNIQRVYQSRGLPTTFVIDREGRIRKKVLGAAAWDKPRYADEIRRLLAS